MACGCKSSFKESETVRDSPINLVKEPSYPGIFTVSFCILHPEFTSHESTIRCQIELPHKISDCGEWNETSRIDANSK